MGMSTVVKTVSCGISVYIVVKTTHIFADCRGYNLNLRRVKWIEQSAHILVLAADVKNAL